MIYTKNFGVKWIISGGRNKVDLYPDNFKEQLDEALKFVKYLKDRGLWESSMRIYKDKNGYLVAE